MKPIPAKCVSLLITNNTDNVRAKNFETKNSHFLIIHN